MHFAELLNQWKENTVALAQAWRWYGPNDTVSLQDIEQAGAPNIVHALHHIPVGEVWTPEEITKRKAFIENANPALRWSVVESVNVHEAIRQGRSDRDAYIAKYIESIKNVGAAGIEVVCYNFMPLLDWTRTTLDYKLPNSALALRFDATAFAAFDLYLLEREGAEAEYPEELKKRAKAFIDAAKKEDIDTLNNNILQGLPGTGEVMTMAYFKELLTDYAHISKEKFRDNLAYFLQAVVPEAEKAGVRLCCHPDDPAFPLFGIPRVASTEEDLTFLVNTIDSPSNGITYCTGSLSSNPSNDLPGIVQRLGSKINFIHLRSVQREEDGSFYEADHLKGSVDMPAVMKELVLEGRRREAEGRADFEIPLRPDHGHQILDDLDKAVLFHGYSAIGRLKGLAELRGLELGISRTLN